MTRQLFLEILIGLFVPLVGTIIGGSFVFFVKKKLNEKLEKALLGFAGGIMLSASFWSLLLPSVEIAKAENVTEWMPAATGFVIGFSFLLLLDSIIPHFHINTNEDEGMKTKIKKATRILLAIILHNIPEGMAVGITYAGIMQNKEGMTVLGALGLALAMAIQNVPEGAIIAVPLKIAGKSKKKAFLFATLSGVVEPIGAILIIFAANIFVPMMPFLLAFAAGAMIYVVVEEIIPASQGGKHSNIGTIGIGVGFIVMMLLDIVLG